MTHEIHPDRLFIRVPTDQKDAAHAALNSEGRGLQVKASEGKKPSDHAVLIVTGKGVVAGDVSKVLQAKGLTIVKPAISQDGQKQEAPLAPPLPRAAE